MYQDLSPRHDWPVKKDIVDLPMKMKGNSSKRASGKSLSSSGAQGPFLESPGKLFGPEIKYSNRNIKNKSAGPC